MLSSGDVVDLDLGLPRGREAGFPHPAVVVTAQRILDASPSVIQVVPPTTAIRPFGSEADDRNGLAATSAAQYQHVRALPVGRIDGIRGNLGAVAMGQVRETLAVILDLPG